MKTKLKKYIKANQNSLHKKGGMLLFALVMVLFCMKFYSTNIKSFPGNIHTWAQGDRYALALNFQRNGFDLLHPQTYNLNPQFPAAVPLSNPKGITQVDCPIHEYVIAAIMTFFRNNSPVVFRLYNLLYALIGFFFLYRIVRFNTHSNIKSIAVIVFAFLSPVLVYYFDGFLPSISSLASVLIGYYFFFEYRRNRIFKNIALAVLFVFIAALSRTPYALFLGSMFCQILFDVIRERRKNTIKPILTFLIAFAILFAYFMYNKWLAKTYGSVFLMNIMPVTNMKEIREIFKHIYDSWFLSYFTIFHYSAFILLLILFIFHWIKNKSLTAFQKAVGFQFIITFLGACAYLSLMVAQFHSHDYYFLDSFYLPCILFLILCMDSFSVKKLYAKIVLMIFTVLLGYFSFGKCQKDMTFRYAEDRNNRFRAETINFQGASAYLDSLKISSDARILVINAWSANNSFNLMNRSGYVLMSPNAGTINDAFTWGFDYVVMQNEFILSDVVNGYPEIINELEPMGTNGKISVFRKEHREKNLMEFLQIKNPILYCVNSCSDREDSCIAYLTRNHSCDSTLKLVPENEFTNLIDIDLDWYNTKDLNLYFTADCRINKFNSGNSDMVVSINEDIKQVYYKSYPLNVYLNNTVASEFKKLYFTYPLVNPDGKAQKMSLYFWNNGKNEIELKNVSIWLAN